MTPPFDAEDRWLRSLSTLQPDAARVARTRQRCRAALQRRRPDRSGQHVTRSAVGHPAWRNAVAGAVAVLCLVYVLSLIVTAAHLGVAIR